MPPEKVYPSRDTAPAGQACKQLPQWMQWLASMLRGAFALMQPQGQTVRQARQPMQRELSMRYPPGAARHPPNEKA